MSAALWQYSDAALVAELGAFGNPVAFNLVANAVGGRRTRFPGNRGKIHSVLARIPPHLGDQRRAEVEAELGVRIRQ
jgi:hypothetical protein